jgi:hypothetical protein
MDATVNTMHMASAPHTTSAAENGSRPTLQSDSRQQTQQMGVPSMDAKGRTSLVACVRPTTAKPELPHYSRRESNPTAMWSDGTAECQCSTDDAGYVARSLMATSNRNTQNLSPLAGTTSRQTGVRRTGRAIAASQASGRSIPRRHTSGLTLHDCHRVART